MQRSVDGGICRPSTAGAAPRRWPDGHREGQAPGRAQKDVLILLDSITRLARPTTPKSSPSSEVLGGLDSNALRSRSASSAPPNIEEGGSLTIIATALIDTGSRMDDVIFEEFKGTGNMEINLDRKLADKRVFPAIDILKSGTRKEELLIPKEDLQRVYVLRRVLNPLFARQAMELLLDRWRRRRAARTSCRRCRRVRITTESGGGNREAGDGNRRPARASEERVSRMVTIKVRQNGSLPSRAGCKARRLERRGVCITSPSRCAAAASRRSGRSATLAKLCSCEAGDAAPGPTAAPPPAQGQ